MTATPLTTWDLAIAAVLVGIGGLVSLLLQLGIGRRLVLAAVRATVQLFLLGYVLHWVFGASGPWPVLLAMLVMGTVAGFEATRRSSRRVKGLLAVTVTTMLASSLAVTVYSLLFVLAADPWWEPRYALPILGMVLGNALNGISLGLDSALEGFERRRDEVELWLTLGATRREASREIVRDAVRRGLIPIINSMVAVGVISIPGMMTGQLLAGQVPTEAARYQLFILYCITGGVALGTVGMVLGAARLVFDDRDRLRVERIRRKR